MFCYQCQYDLQHRSKDECPECGRAFNPEDPSSYLPLPLRTLPLLSKRASLAFCCWAAHNKSIAFVLCIAIQLGLRSAGIAFATMTLLIPWLEGESGQSRTHVVNVLIMDGVILAGFYVSHVLIGLLKQAGVRDTIGLWAYPLGILVAVLLFNSPLRP